MPGDRIELIEQAHLRDEEGYTPPISRYLPAEDLAPMVRRYWIPVWSLPPGRRTVQRVLQYPVCLMVIAPTYARVVGPDTGLGTQELRGNGWALGALFEPATGSMVLGGPVSAVTDGFADLAQLSTIDGAALAAGVRDRLGPDPTSQKQQRRAIELIEEALRGLGPVEEEGLLVNRIVEYVEQGGDVVRVSQICREFSIGERSLQRLTARRLGLSPKWLIQRRRLQQAAQRLRADTAAVDLAAVAADSGYADQAHFTRDFRVVTGLTPARFAAEPGRL